MPQWTRYVGTLLLVVTVGLGSAQADEAEGTPLETRIFEVGALTTGFCDYYPGTPALLSPDLVSDEDSPLFGAEGEEPIYAAGTREDLIELLRSYVAPESWDSIPGVLTLPLGRSSLLVRSTPQVIRQVAEALAGLESALLKSVTVESINLRSYNDLTTPAGV